MDQRNRPETPLGKLLRYSTYATSAVGVLWYAAAGSVYSRQLEKQRRLDAIDIPGVSRIEHHSLYGSKVVGNQIKLTFPDGTGAIIRDHNGDFELQEEDSMEGSVPAEVTLPDVLEKVREEIEDLKG